MPARKPAERSASKITLPELSWRHVVAILCVTVPGFFAAWQAPVVTIAVAWMLRELFDERISEIAGRRS